ncbi:MAG: prepilin peptidase [Bacillota bacterium]
MDLLLPISVLLGGLLGECMRHLTRLLIKNRVGQDTKSPFLNGRWSTALWIMAGAVGCGVIALWTSEIVIGIEYMGIFLVLISLSAVDNSIRKIPNELILALLILRLSAIAMQGDPAAFLPAVEGLAVGLILFLIPSRLGICIGWGDIKLAAAAGFCLGVVGILQAALVMAAVLAIYSLYLIISKRGNLKTKVAIGPPLSLGMMVTLMFPLTLAF